MFLNKTGAPLNSDQFRADHWGGALETLEIRKRKFYACRYTLVTEMVKAGLNLKAIAQYVGTSVTMIEDNYCGNLELDPTIFQRVSDNFVDILASPTGFELESAKVDDGVEEFELIDISKPKKVGLASRIRFPGSPLILPIKSRKNRNGSGSPLIGSLDPLPGFDWRDLELATDIGRVIRANPKQNQRQCFESAKSGN